MTNDTPTPDMMTEPWYECTYRHQGCKWTSGMDPNQTRVEARRDLSDHMNKEHKHS